VLREVKKLNKVADESFLKDNAHGYMRALMIRAWVIGNTILIAAPSGQKQSGHRKFVLK